MARHYPTRSTMMPSAGAQAKRLERRGDRGVYRGDVAAAKVGYGRAIDAYLELRDIDSAVRTCRKLIRLAPDVVRTRYTLACLLVGQRRVEEAEEALREYTRSVLETATLGYAVPRLVLLSAVATDARLRESIGRLLLELGAIPEGATALERARALAEATAPRAEPATHWDRILRLATL